MPTGSPAPFPWREIKTMVYRWNQEGHGDQAEELRRLLLPYTPDDGHIDQMESYGDHPGAFFPTPQIREVFLTGASLDPNTFVEFVEWRVAIVAARDDGCTPVVLAWSVNPLTEDQFERLQEVARNLGVKHVAILRWERASWVPVGATPIPWQPSSDDEFLRFLQTELVPMMQAIPGVLSREDH